MRSQISLHKKLRKAVIFTASFFSIIAILTAGIVTYEEAAEQQDYILQFIGRLAASKQIENPIVNQESPALDDDEEQILFQFLSINPDAGLGLTNISLLGLRTIVYKEESWRVFVGVTSPPNREKYIVAQRIDARRDIAMESAVSIVLPILLMLGFMLLILKIVIDSELRPLTDLSGFIDRQDPNQLNPLPLNDSFKELTPFLKSINRLIERTNESVKNQKRFIADAAHELRTPITALSLLNENLDKAKDREDLNKRRALLTQSLGRIKNLVVQLLDLARIQNEEHIAPKKVRIDTALTEVISDIVPMIERRKIKLNTTIEKDITVYDKGERLRQLFKNTIENSVFHSPDGSEIDLTLQSRDGHAIFLLEDNGPGLPEDDLERIWEPFYRGKSSQSEGSGLGLSIVKEISKQLGGKLKFENRAHGGARFVYEQNTEAPDGK